MKSGRDRRSWFAWLPGGTGMLAFVLHRLSGLALVAYLYLHLVVLHQLQNGPAGWDRFVASVRSPVFLMLDVLLLGGMLVHGLNGLRLTLLGLGRGIGIQKPLFWGALSLAVLITALGLALLSKM